MTDLSHLDKPAREKRQALRCARIDGGATKAEREYILAVAEQLRRETAERAGNQIHRLESGHPPLMGRMDG